jgi:hypothetical protein
LGGNVVSGVKTPVSATDAANKAYVDAAVNGGNKTFTSLTVTGTSTFGSGGQTTIDANGNITTTNGFGDTASVTADVGNLFGGFKATSGLDSRVATLSAPGLNLNNGTTDTVTLDTTTGNGSFAGKVTIGNGLKVSGPSDLDGLVTFTNSAVAGQGSSTINGGVMVLTNGSNPAQTITLDANADPVFTVSGGTPATTTTIDNGDVTAGGNIKAGGTLSVGGTATVSGQSFLNGGATISNNLTVSSNTNVDFGGNRLQNVAAPVAPTDAANKAYVDQGNSTLNRRVDKAFEGTAMALSLEQPIMLPGQSFAIRGGWGSFEDANAFGVSAAGVLSRNVFGPGTSATLDGGVGVSTDSGAVTGKAGVTFGW